VSGECIAENERGRLPSSSVFSHEQARNWQGTGKELGKKLGKPNRLPATINVKTGDKPMKAKQLFVGIATACALLGLASSAALADDGKSFPATMCQVSGSSQDIYYGAGLVANRGAATRSVVCPIVRDKMNAPAIWIEIEVRDRHVTQDIQCTARSMAPDGSGGWQQTLSTTGTGFQTLTFAPAAAPPWGAYVVTCSLPGMTNNVPSYIASYRILEP
jgi:hypothetical protein